MTLDFLVDFLTGVLADFLLDSVTISGVLVAFNVSSVFLEGVLFVGVALRFLALDRDGVALALRALALVGVSLVLDFLALDLVGVALVFLALALVGVGLAFLALTLVGVSLVLAFLVLALVGVALVFLALALVGVGLAFRALALVGVSLALAFLALALVGVALAFVGVPLVLAFLELYLVGDSPATAFLALALVGVALVAFLAEDLAGVASFCGVSSFLDFLDDLVSAVGLLSGVVSRGNSTMAVLDGVEAFWDDLFSSMTALTTLAAPRCDFVDRVVDLLLVEGLCSASVGVLSTSLERVALADGLFWGVDLAARGEGRRRVLLAPNKKIFNFIHIKTY